MDAGWTWKIPMLTRFGSGYVYSSRFATVDQAVRDYCKLWNLQESEMHFNQIRFRTGRNARAWVKNCVSIGLSGCFIEPLESTGIYFITASIYQLAKHFPAAGCDPKLIAAFNREVEYMFDDSRDFLQAHYFTTTRDDSPFWRACKNELTLSDDMKEKIERYKAGLPINPPLTSEADYYGSFDVEFRNFWTNGSYYAIFGGMGFLPDSKYPPLRYRPRDVAAAEETFGKVKRAQRDLVARLPTNYAFLSKLHASESSASRSPALRLSHAT
jgi:tryptophan halogenase